MRLPTVAALLFLLVLAAPTEGFLPPSLALSSRGYGVGRQLTNAAPAGWGSQAPRPVAVGGCGLLRAEREGDSGEQRPRVRRARHFVAGIALAVALRVSFLAPSPAKARAIGGSAVVEDAVSDVDEAHIVGEDMYGEVGVDGEESDTYGGSGLRKNQFAIWMGIAQRAPTIKHLQWYEDSTTFYDNTASRFAVGSFSAYMLYRARVSAISLNKQRKRVRNESTKLKELAEEWMGVEGEASYDEDIMLELRKMKETRTSAGSKYAKETRKHNPDFAESHGEVDKITDHFKEVGIKPKGGKSIDADDLLNMDEDDESSEESQTSGQASDLQNLFDKSPEEEEQE